ISNSNHHPFINLGYARSQDGKATTLYNGTAVCHVPEAEAHTDPKPSGTGPGDGAMGQDGEVPSMKSMMAEAKRYGDIIDGIVDKQNLGHEDGAEEEEARGGVVEGTSEDTYTLPTSGHAEAAGAEDELSDEATSQPDSEEDEPEAYDNAGNEDDAHQSATGPWEAADAYNLKTITRNGHTAEPRDPAGQFNHESSLGWANGEAMTYGTNHAVVYRGLVMSYNWNRRHEQGWQFDENPSEAEIAEIARMLNRENWESRV
ncbi:hypothetical protein LTR17_024332, partial [Elasticomyces elasticus]